MSVQIVPRSEWRPLAETAHSAVFGTHRPADLDRSSYTIFLTGDNNTPLAYVQVRATDADSVYWQYGGVFPDVPLVHRLNLQRELLKAQKRGGTKRVTVGVSNRNIAYLKMCLAVGFVIIGTRYDGKDLYVELTTEL